MSRFANLVLLPGLLLAQHAGADPRVTTRFYQPSEVVTLHGRNGVESTIAFAPDERIENVAIGDSSGWEVIPNKRADLLFAKPIKPRAQTNMTVVTDQRTYLFDLVAAPAGSPVYMLQFTYPNPPKVEAPPAIEKAVVTAPVLPIQPDPPTPPAATPASLNFAWVARGPRPLLPARTFDDGQATYISWPAETTLPAVLTREPSGVEGPVNYSVKGEYLVIPGVPDMIILRSGKQMATLTPGTPPTHPPTRRAPPPSLPMASSVAVPIRLPQTASAQ